MSKHETGHDRRGRSSRSTSHDPSPQAAGHRHERLTRILHEEASARWCATSLADPRLHEVTFTSVELSVDYRNARVGFVGPAAGRAPREERERLERLLARGDAGVPPRARLADAVDLKQVPVLRFAWDVYAAEDPPP